MQELQLSKNEGNMKKTDDDLREEYEFDYSKAKINRFAKDAKIKYTVVDLEEDVAKVFNSRESVNNALRAIISAMPSKRKQRFNKTPKQ